jgi:hypothetical protein
MSLPSHNPPTPYGVNGGRGSWAFVHDVYKDYVFFLFVFLISNTLARTIRKVHGHHGHRQRRELEKESFFWLIPAP